MILFNPVAEVLVLSQLARLRQRLILLKCDKGWGISRMLIYINGTRSLAIGSIQSFAEEPSRISYPTRKPNFCNKTYLSADSVASILELVLQSPGDGKVHRHV